MLPYSYVSIWLLEGWTVYNVSFFIANVGILLAWQLKIKKACYRGQKRLGRKKPVNRTRTLPTSTPGCESDPFYIGPFLWGTLRETQERENERERCGMITLSLVCNYMVIIRADQTQTNQKSSGAISFHFVSGIYNILPVILDYDMTTGQVSLTTMYEDLH